MPLPSPKKTQYEAERPTTEYRVAPCDFEAYLRSNVDAWLRRQLNAFNVVFAQVGDRQVIRITWRGKSKPEEARRAIEEAGFNFH